jgi:hypothetical protein
LFCRGVPVMSSRNCVFIFRTAKLSDDFSFLIRCAFARDQIQSRVRVRVTKWRTKSRRELTSSIIRYLE